MDVTRMIQVAVAKADLMIMSVWKYIRAAPLLILAAMLIWLTCRTVKRRVSR